MQILQNKIYHVSKAITFIYVIAIADGGLGIPAILPNPSIKTSVRHCPLVTQVLNLLSHFRKKNLHYILLVILKL